MENNKNKKSVKFQGDMLNFCDFIQVFVFTRNHHLNYQLLHENCVKTGHPWHDHMGQVHQQNDFVYFITLLTLFKLLIHFRSSRLLKTLQTKRDQYITAVSCGQVINVTLANVSNSQHEF